MHERTRNLIRMYEDRFGYLPFYQIEDNTEEDIQQILEDCVMNNDPLPEEYEYPDDMY